MSEFKITNFITGEEVNLDRNPDDGPTKEWIEGWDDYMIRGYSTNPYETGSTEAREWQDGYDAAERD